MTTVNSPQYAIHAPITNRYARNGRYPDANHQNDLAQQCNHAARWLTKEPFSYSCGIASIPASRDTGRDRWRFAWRSGPYARYVLVHAVMAPTTTSAAASPHALLTVTNGAGSTIGTAKFSNSMSTNHGASDTPFYFNASTQVLQSSGAAVELDANTEYFGFVQDVDYGRIVSISVREVSVDSDTDNGFTSYVHAGSPILDTDRSTVATMARNMWKQGARQVLNWAVNDGGVPMTTTSATPANLIDVAVTTITAASPGYVIDWSNRTRVSGSGVPIVMKVYASRGTDDGHVYLMGEDTSTIASIDVTGAAAWYSTTAIVDPSIFGDIANGKVDLHFDSQGGTCSVHAISIFEYES